MDDTPVPLGVETSPLRELTIEIHELYLELQESGFEPREALHILGDVLTNMISDRIMYSDDEDDDEEEDDDGDSERTG